MFTDRNRLRRQTFALSYLEGALYALMVGSAETYALVFAVKKGITDSGFGILATLPIVLGAFSAWLIPSLSQHHQMKRSLLISVGIQVLGLLGLFISSQVSYYFEVLLISLSLYWIGGMAAGPLWLDWMSAWLPRSKFQRFLSRRNAFVAVMTLLSYILASYFLIDTENPEIFGFVFLVAFSARCLSLICLSKHAVSKSGSLQQLEPLGLWPQGLHSRKWILAILLLAFCFKFAAGLASPYFTPYMLRELKLSLTDFVWITSIPFVARALCLAQWGRVGIFFQPLAALKISCFGIALVAFLWGYFSSTRALVGIEILSGVFWAGFELSLVLVLQSAYRGNARHLIGMSVAFMNLGALLAAQLGSQLLRTSSYQELFRDSGYLRLGVAVVLFAIGRYFPELHSTRQNLQEFLSSTLSIRPSLSNIGRLIPVRMKPKL